MAEISAARENPYAEFMHWELSSFHIIYDICDEHADHDEGLGRGNFPIEAAPLPHPFCTCLWYTDCTRSLDEIARELYRWGQGESVPRLDAAFGYWREENGFTPELNSATMGRNSQAVGEDEVQSLCKLDVKTYSCVTDQITTDEVVITRKQIEHIQLRHPMDYERYLAYIPDMIQNPDYIIETKSPATAFVLKQYVEEEKQFRLILRLHVANDPENYKNSVITFQYVSEREYRRLIRSKKILYKKE